MIRTTLLRFALLAAALFAAPAAFAQEHAGTGHDNEAHEQAGHEEKSTLDMAPSEFFLTQFSHLMPHAVGAGHGDHSEQPEPTVTTFYDVNLFQLYALGIILIIFVPVLLSFRSGANGWFVRVFRGWVHWLRDEVVYATMGEEEGKRFAPFFVFMFFFILLMNLLGLIPGSVTATATVFVTGAMAVVTFAIMVGGGMMRQGPGNYIKHLLPGGLPGWLVPLMAIVEFIGLFVKPIALTIRLFANMLAGHLLIYSFIGMIFIFAQLCELGFVTWVPAVLTTAMAIFINIIEAFVVVLQAYIFTFLSVMFVQDSLHPAH